MKALINRLFGFTVWVEWDTLHVEHKARSMSEAYDWMSQYPNDADVYIFNRKIEVVASRCAFSRG